MNIFKKISEKFKTGEGMSRQMKRNLILAASLVIISTAVFLNWRLSKGDGTIDGIVEAGKNDKIEESGSKVLGDSVEVDKKAEDDYFAVSVIDRERVRDEAIETLREVLENDAASAETKQNALDKMTSLADAMTEEVNIENLVMAKGFKNCVAVVGDESVDVIVQCEELMPNELAQIKDIAVKQTSADTEVRIISHK